MLRKSYRCTKSFIFIRGIYICDGATVTVKPPKRGHFGDGPFVLCREVVLFLEVYTLNLYTKINVL